MTSTEEKQIKKALSLLDSKQILKDDQQVFINVGSVKDILKRLLHHEQR